MSSSESDSTFVDEDEDEEGKIYRWIYELMKEEAEIPSSSELEPVQTEDERKTNDTGTLGNTEGLHEDVAGDFQVKRKSKAKAEKRPWRRAGADISDYFNYGFDEESWNSYCKKQTQLHGGHSNKFKDQKGQSTHEENPSGHGSSSHTPSMRASSHHRQSRRDVTGGKAGHSRREQRRRITDEGDKTRVGNGKSPEEETMNSYNLSSSSSTGSGYDFILPQRVHSRSRPRPLRQHLTDSSKRLDVPSASLNKHSSGATSSIRKTPACSSGVMDAAEAWESFILQDMREEGRSRERRSDRERDKESCSSAHSSRKEQQRHWEPTKQGHERSSEGREDKKSSRAEQEASSHSSSRMMSRKEKDGDTKRSHKHKKCRRRKKAAA